MPRCIMRTTIYPKDIAVLFEGGFQIWKLSAWSHDIMTNWVVLKQSDCRSDGIYFPVSFLQQIKGFIEKILAN